MSATAHVAEPIVIGYIGSLTAALSFQKPFNKAYEVAIEEINTRGGILRRPVKLLMYDHQGQPEVALSLARQLVNHKPMHLLTFSGLANIELTPVSVCAPTQTPLAFWHLSMMATDSSDKRAIATPFGLEATPLSLQ